VSRAARLLIISTRRRITMTRFNQSQRFVLSFRATRPSMRGAALSVALAVALLAPLSLARAATIDPSGHWDGTIRTPSQEIDISIDLALDKSGKLTGTLSNPGEGITGYPLSAAAIDGNTVHLEIRTGGAGAQTLAGSVAADGKSMSGDFLVGVYSVPFELKR